MNCPRLVLLCSGVALLLLAGAPSALAQAPTPAPWMPCSGANLVDQSFPTAGPEQTHWRFCWEAAPGSGLIIHWAFFRKAPSSKWLWIFWDARVSQIFVPYHSGWPRYYDVDYLFPLTAIGPKDCPAVVGGKVFGGNVCEEVHDRGLAWKSDSNVRRGQEVVLWGALAAANYNYVIEWTFRDDGVVLGRVGATSANLPSAPLEAHVHNPIWRLDIDLDGWPNDEVYLGTHTEPLPGLAATDSEVLVPVEAGLEWDPHAFNSLDVFDKFLTNGRGDRTSYMLMPLPTAGLSRHNEDFTQKDFWVTHYDPSEMDAAYLSSYITPPEPVVDTDIVVWYKGSIHHHPRDEDGQIVAGTWNGVALVMWTGFMLKPNNLFDTTPLYP